MPITQPNDPKPKWQSKTLWTNLGAIATAIGAYFATGDTTALGAALLGGINIVLRLVTKQPLE